MTRVRALNHHRNMCIISMRRFWTYTRETTTNVKVHRNRARRARVKSLSAYSTSSSSQIFCQLKTAKQEGGYRAASSGWVSPSPPPPPHSPHLLSLRSVSPLSLRTGRAGRAGQGGTGRVSVGNLNYIFFKITNNSRKDIITLNVLL